VPDQLDDAAVAGGDEQLHHALGEDVHAVARLVLGEHALAPFDDPFGDVLGDAPLRRLVDPLEQLGPSQNGGPVLEVHVGRRSYDVPAPAGEPGPGCRKRQQPDSPAVGAWTAGGAAASETAGRRPKAATGNGVSAMTIRIVSRLTLLLVVLAAATALVVGALSLLASATPADAAPLPERDQVAAVERAVEPRAEEAAGATPTQAVVLVFAGIVLMAALPPIHRVHVYHRSHHADWF
jgi:hypothetical protein